ncbi:hypothetical protein [Pseudomonas sp. NPDC086278]|uniref:hypothetical protein n=1 Tax=Pseudomonas sp. NPDC086278 TaxID=3390646 RepID=UPI003CFD6D80
MTLLVSFFRRMALGYWLAAALTTFFIVMSLDLGQEHTVYRMTVTPVGEGDVRLVFFGKSYEQYLTERKIDIPDTGWKVTVLTDATILQSEKDTGPVTITTEEEPVRLWLLRHPQGGTAAISNEAGETKKVSLYGATESFWPLVVGGPESSLPYSTKSPIYQPYWITASILIFFLLSFLALRINETQERAKSNTSRPRRWEIAAVALPLILSTTITLIAFFPGNVSYDGSLQWVQAISRGELTPTIGYPTTYFMRLFTYFSNSPLTLLVMQSIFAALGVALVLHEIRHRNVPFLWIFLTTLAISATPQYPTFFTSLGKDPLCTVGMLFFVWTLLVLFRHPAKSKPSFYTLSVLIISGAFAGLMRFNALPVFLMVTLLALAVLYFRSRDRRLAIAGVLFILLVFALPKALTTMAHQENYEHNQNPAELAIEGLPLGTFATAYIYHLFSAAVAHGTTIPVEDAALFYSIAPREAWTIYNCSMTDTTFTGVNNGLLLKPLQYADYLKTNQVEMFYSVARLIFLHPELLLERQTCITKVIWHIGFGQIPFQTTATLGYDIVDSRFSALAGNSTSIFPKLREVLEGYKKWTEGQYWFWLFWRPALFLGVGFFILGVYVTKRKDPEIFLIALVPLISILLLLLIIPFPAYRYIYPSVFLLTLLGTLAFSRAPQKNSTHLMSDNSLT